MSGRDHSIQCKTCGVQRGGINDYKCPCDVLLAAELYRISLSHEPQGTDDLDREIKSTDDLDREIQRLESESCPSPRWERGLGWLRELQQLRAEQISTALQRPAAPLVDAPPNAGAPPDDTLSAEIKMMEDAGLLDLRWQRGLAWLRELQDLRQRRAGQGVSLLDNSPSSPFLTPAQRATMRHFFHIDTATFQGRVINGDEDDRLVELINAFDAFFVMCRAKFAHNHVPIGIWETYKMIKARRAFVVPSDDDQTDPLDVPKPMATEMPGADYLPVAAATSLPIAPIAPPGEGFSPKLLASLRRDARRANKADALATHVRFRRTVHCVWCGNRYRSAVPGDFDRNLQGSHCASDVVQEDGAWYVRGGYGSDEHDMHRYLFVANPPSAPADPVCDECISERLQAGVPERV